MKKRLFLRSFFNQALLNYRGMTHIGILWALLPKLREESRDRPQRLERAFGFFNSHPYLAGYIIGASARMEEEHEGEMLERLKRAAVAPLGAVGDRLFWFYLKPLSGVICCSGVMLWLSGWMRTGIAIILLGLVSYNAFHLWIRWRGISRGLELGRDVYKDILALKQHGLNHFVSIGLSLCAGLFLGICFSHARLTGMGWWELGGLGIVTLLSWQLPERNWALPGFLVCLAAAVWLLN